MQVIPNRQKPTLQNFIVRNTKEGTMVFTDEATGYKGIDKRGYKHKAVKHKEKKFVDGMAHTNGIESVWAMVKRGYDGIYHHMSEQQLHRYLYEFGGRA